MERTICLPLSRSVCSVLPPASHESLLGRGKVYYLGSNFPHFRFQERLEELLVLGPKVTVFGSMREIDYN